MAHKYANFADAFAALIPFWDSASTYYGTGSTEQTAALMDWIVANDHAAIGHLCNAVYWSLQSTKALARLDETDSDQSELMESIYWAGMGDGGGAVDMDAIVNAMLAATFDQLQRFIGIEDAYRVALWNAPFNADFYAALARGFVKWP